MNETASQPLQAFDRNGIQKVIINQYLLHETKHHPAVKNGETRTPTVRPRAHRMADIYKCLQHCTFGRSAAAGVAQPQSRDWLIDHMTGEYFEARPDPEQPLLEFIAPDDSVIRVNFRPYRALFQDREQEGLDMLVDLIMDSSEIEKGSVKQFFTTLKSFVEMNNGGEIHIDGRSYIIPSAQIDAFFNDVQRFMRSNGEIPRLGHSETYRRLNDPSYMVADLAVLKESPLAFLLEHYNEWEANHLKGSRKQPGTERLSRTG
jgi:hypothetical protein